MPSPLLQGGTRRRRRLLRRRELRPRPPRQRRTRLWTGLAVVLLAAVAGAASWYVWLRPGHHGTAEAAVRHPHHAPAPRRPPGPPGIYFPGRNVLPIHFGQPPRAGVLFSLDSGEVLWSTSPLEPVPVASLTKIMSAVIIVEHTHDSELAPVTHEALSYQGQALGELPPRRRVPVRGLLAGMLLTSANDATIDLADLVAGSDRNFAAMMNTEAQQLGLRCSHFVSSYGLQDANVSCAGDLAALARIAMSKPRISELSSQSQAKVAFPIKGGYLYVSSTNPLYAINYPGTIGLKTGTTTKAGHCLVAIVRRRGRTFGAVLLNSPNPASQAVKLFNAAFAHPA
jgi:serine-type D-Ala-D-Ala carboxypeptidase (penicillin-binding protein 5/6)